MIISNIEAAELSDNECDEVHVDAGGCGDEGADVDSYGHCDSGGVENTDVIHSHEANLRQVEDHSKKKKTDLSSPGDGIDWVTNILETKPATSVSKLLGVTPLVNTLDKARKALHKKENCQKRYYQNKYKDTLASVQTQVLAATKSTQRK